MYSFDRNDERVEATCSYLQHQDPMALVQEATLANSTCSNRIQWPWSCPGRGLSNHERRSISHEIASCGLESHLGELCDFKFGMEATLANSRVSDPGCKHRFSRPWRTLGSGAELCSCKTACSQGDSGTLGNTLANSWRELLTTI